MQCTWTPAQDAFRAEVRNWFDQNVPSVSAAVSTFTDPAAAKGPLREWERSLSAAGYNAISWPVEFGGRGLDPLYATIFHEEYFRSGAPRRLNYPGLGLLGPTLMAVGTEEQKRTLIPRILSCEDIWCQGFSEPDAGSDLASLRTRAIRDGDHFVVDGQKTWASNGPLANMMFALVRTNPDASKHHGISYLLIDLESPGVDVRPIKQVNGASLFAEIFLDGVQVPVANLVGSENEGWQVAGQTLAIERAPTESPVQLYRNVFAQLCSVVGETDSTDWSELARMQARVDCYQWNYYASVSSARRRDIGTLNALSKLHGSELLTTLYEGLLRGLGDGVETGSEGLPESLPRDTHERYWHARASHIYAGTNEIQRNMIAERVLGLPRDARS
jgi:alkylation response protein AidB-like acyl-CoA dehydrogenase